MSFTGKATEKMKEAMKQAMIYTGKTNDAMQDELTELTAAFLRPVYQYTSLENDTVARLHENDYLKDKRPYRARG